MLKKILIVLMVILISVPVFSYTEQDYIDIINELVESNEQLIEVIEKQNSDILVLKDTIKSDNELILTLRKQIEEDGKEIVKLRSAVTDVSKQVVTSSNYYLGLGVSYPLGGTVVFGVRPKSVPIGGFVSGNINDRLGLSVSLGVSYSF